MALIGTEGTGVWPALATSKGPGVKRYKQIINGIETELLLSDEDAAERGLVETKARTPANKARTPAAKSPAPAKRAASAPAKKAPAKKAATPAQKRAEVAQKAWQGKKAR